jgi:hypothetical protein
MNVSRLARSMCQLTAWLETQEGATYERHALDGPPYGRSYLSLDPGSSSPAASFNNNRITLCGADGGLTGQGLRELVARFSDRGIRRVFVWLNPGSDMERVRDWLAGLSFVRVPWTRYPTLMLGEPAQAAGGHGFDIRQIGVAAFAAAKTALGESLFEGFARTLQKPGFFHYVCY